MSLLEVLKHSSVSLQRQRVLGGVEASRLQVVAAQDCIHLCCLQATNHHGHGSTLDPKTFFCF